MHQENYYSVFKEKQRKLYDCIQSKIETLSNDDFTIYHDFEGVSLDKKEVLEGNVLTKIEDTFRIKHFGLIRLQPNACYNWHVDSKRGLAINMLMSYNHESLTLFGETNQLLPNQIITKRLVYEPEFLYLFNTQISHTVINTTETRYLLSIELEQPKEILSYYDVLAWKKENNL